MMLTDLPDTYTLNLADMTPKQCAAVEEDRKRWHDAHKMTIGMKPGEIRTWLAKQADEAYRDDLARRLNAIRDRKRKGK